MANPLVAGSMAFLSLFGIGGQADEGDAAPAGNDTNVVASAEAETVSKESPRSTDDRAQMVDKVNEFRQENHQGTVEESDSLNDEAQKWADQLASTGRFEHDKMRCEQGKCLSENIAITAGDSIQAIQQWKDSPGHRANMLKPEAKEVGHGIAIMKSGQFKGQPVVVQRFWNS